MSDDSALVAEKRLPLRVLIADDNQDAADSTAMLLRYWGYEVEVAYDGKAAVRQAVHDHPDLILLDIQMPGKNGYEVAREVRRRDCVNETALVALTAFSGAEHNWLSQNAGFDLELVKPVDIDLLQKVLNTMQRIKALQNQAQQAYEHNVEPRFQARQLLAELRENLE